MFNVQTINCLQYNSEPVVLNSITETRSQSRNEINTHTKHLVQKQNDLLSLKGSYLVLSEENNKETRKKS